MLNAINALHFSQFLGWSAFQHERLQLVQSESESLVSEDEEDDDEEDESELELLALRREATA